MKYSDFLSLNGHDLIKGAIMAAGGAAYAILEPLLSTGNFEVDWRNVAKIAVGSALVYLMKNLLTTPPKTITIDPNQTTVIQKH